MSTALEQDFTVEGKKGQLDCPFSTKEPAEDAEKQELHGKGSNVVDGKEPTPHETADPICAAMYEETKPGAAANNSAVKCPIRYMDQHSPEEIAHYVETHKHELPRSHEVCLRRYHRNETQIRKLDAKYGSLVSMIQGLSQLHQPMLPEDEQRQAESELDRASNERVESWAQAVSVTASDDPEEAQDEPDEAADEDRESHFNRPLKEVRVGESPSRPWGISVPVFEPVPLSEGGRPLSPPPAPVLMPSPDQSPRTPGKVVGKCPFDFTKLAEGEGLQPPFPKPQDHPAENHQPTAVAPVIMEKQQAETSARPQQPTFINPPDTKMPGYSNPPQMVFTGPVFIGYPIEQAIQFMQQLQRNQ